jgi:hypothetical protein
MFVDAFQQMLNAAADLPPNDEPREALVDFVEFCIRFATEDAVRHQLMFQRTIPGFKPSPASRELVLAFREVGGERLRAVGVKDMPTADIFTSLVAGLTNQQVFNDPHGDRFLRQARRVVEMFLADFDRHARGAPKTPAEKTRTKGR